MTIADFTFNNELNWFENGNKAIDFVDGGYVAMDDDEGSESDILDTMEEAVNWFNA
jgi:hypothetical protein